MNYALYYEKLNGLVAMELFNYGDALSLVENDFSAEIMYLNNMTLEVFSKEEERAMFEILRLFDIYYRNGKPLIDDSFYEGLFTVYQEKCGAAAEVIQFEPSIDAWKKYLHYMVMGSLDKASTVEEIEKWNEKKHIKGVPSVTSEKLDGISLEAIYERGKFKRAVTRGDGKRGDDITANAIYFDGMVKEIQEPWDCSVRGEVVITKDNLVEINKILVANGKEALKNARNGVSGMATRYKGRNEEILSLITFVAFDVQVTKIHKTHENVI